MTRKTIQERCCSMTEIKLPGKVAKFPEKVANLTLTSNFFFSNYLETDHLSSPSVAETVQCAL